jgi:hydrogenase nickel incorporation protein HypA/HybF
MLAGMHEKSLIDDLMRKILLLAKDKQATAITKVRVKLGALSHLSKEHFKEHFDAASQGTIAQDAAIEIEEGKNIDDPDASSIVLKTIDVY